MSAAPFHDEFPTAAIAALVALLVVSFLYSVLVRASIVEWVGIWDEVIRIALALFVVYLFARLVRAVERIADSL